MIDPFDAALSEFIDTLPEEPQAARRLLEENAPFTGRGDLPELAELATMLRSVPPHEPRPEWMAASKERLMSAPLMPPENRGFTWLGSMFLPFTQLSWPSLALPRLSMPSPLFARAAVAAILVGALASVAHNRAGQNPIMQVTADQAPVESAQQAIAATQEQVSRLADSRQGQVAGVEIQGTPHDVVLLSQRIDLAELAIDKAPQSDQPRLRAELQSAVRAVRFDGVLEGVTNGNTLQVSGVAVQADSSMIGQLKVGQPVTLLVAVNGAGKLQAVQANPVAPPPAPAPAVTQASQLASPAPGASSSPAPPLPGAGGGTAPPTSSSNTSNVSAAVDPPSPAASPSPAPDTRRKMDRRRDWDAGNGMGSGASNGVSGQVAGVSLPTGAGLGPGPHGRDGGNAGNSAAVPAGAVAPAGNGSAGPNGSPQASPGTSSGPSSGAGHSSHWRMENASPSDDGSSRGSPGAGQARPQAAHALAEMRVAVSNIESHGDGNHGRDKGRLRG